MRSMEHSYHRTERIFPRPSHLEVDPWIERLEWLMDRSIPVGRWSFGLDPLLDLIPGFGDALSTLISMAIVFRGVQVGLPKSAIARMMLNVGIDTIAGAVPILGNLFDFAFKSNTRNVAIFRTALAGRRESRSDWAFVIALLLAFGFILAMPFLLLAWLVSHFGWV